MLRAWYRTRWARRIDQAELFADVRQGGRREEHARELSQRSVDVAGVGGRVLERRTPPAADVNRSVSDPVERAHHEGVRQRAVERAPSIRGDADPACEVVEIAEVERGGERMPGPGIVRDGVVDHREASGFQALKEGVVPESVQLLQDLAVGVSIEHEVVDVVGRTDGSADPGDADVIARGGAASQRRTRCRDRDEVHDQEPARDERGRRQQPLGDPTPGDHDEPCDRQRAERDEEHRQLARSRGCVRLTGDVTEREQQDHEETRGDGSPDAVSVREPGHRQDHQRGRPHREQDAQNLHYRDALLQVRGPQVHDGNGGDRERSADRLHATA
jgi:hypothetical protein